MNRSEAEVLAAHLGDAWGKALGDVWVEHFATLDAGIAGTVMVRMRTAPRNQRDLAAFDAAYHAIARANSPRPKCEHCHGCGMIPAPGEWRAESVPCHCPEGDRMARLIAGMIRRDDAPSVHLTSEMCAIGFAGIDAVRSELAERRAARKQARA